MLAMLVLLVLAVPEETHRADVYTAGPAGEIVYGMMPAAVEVHAEGTATMNEDQLELIIEQLKFLIQWVIAPGVMTIIALVGILYRQTMKAVDSKASAESVSDVKVELNELCDRIAVLEEARHKHGTELVALREQVQDLRDRLGDP